VFTRTLRLVMTSDFNPPVDTNRHCPLSPPNGPNEPRAVPT
jgi:hypothetical protein